MTIVAVQARPEGRQVRPRRGREKQIDFGRYSSDSNIEDLVAKRGSCQGRLLNFWCRKLDNYSQRTREEEQLGLGWGSYVKSVRSVLNGHVWGSFDIYK